MSSSGQAVVPLRKGQIGPERLVTTKGYSTSMALSTMKHLLVTQKLRRGDGPFSLAYSRRYQRLFGQQGRTSTYRSNRIKHELMGIDYNPREDTCVKAFVRLLASAATQAIREDAAIGEDAAGRSG